MGSNPTATAAQSPGNRSRLPGLCHVVAVLVADVTAVGVLARRLPRRALTPLREETVQRREPGVADAEHQPPTITVNARGWGRAASPITHLVSTPNVMPVLAVAIANIFDSGENQDRLPV